MDVREKLVELIQRAVGGCARHWASLIADHLIANGVTVADGKDTDVPAGTAERRMSMEEVKDYPPYLDYPRKQKQMTNGDRIRAMSDEELAEFLNRVKEPCGYCQLLAVAGACTETLCDDAMEEWLKQPAEENAND